MEKSILNNFILYRHISPSGKVYIGQTNNVNKRWCPSNYKGCKVFYNAILKYGWDNFKHEILFKNLTKEKVNYLEIELIRHYKWLGISYNITDGGEGTLGRTPWNKGTKGQMPIPWNKGKSWVSEIKDKISKSKKGVKLGSQSSEHIKHKVEKHKIPVLQFDIDSGFVKRWSSAIDIERSHFLHPNHKVINSCCREKCWSVKGYVFIYEKDFSIDYINYRFKRQLIGEKYISKKIPEGINLTSANNLQEWLNKL